MESTYFTNMDRRTFIGRLATIIYTSVSTGLLSAIPLHVFALRGETNWRFCHKCNTLFYDGRRDKGRCSAGSGHEPAGFNFQMLIGGVGEEVPPGQTYWRRCKKCYAMYYGGFRDKYGNCPAGGGHVMDGELYTLEHDRGASPTEQRDWRFCNKCYVLFFDGFPNKGRCPTGNGHVAQGFNFVLKRCCTIDE